MLFVDAPLLAATPSSFPRRYADLLPDDAAIEGRVFHWNGEQILTSGMQAELLGHFLDFHRSGRIFVTSDELRERIDKLDRELHESNEQLRDKRLFKYRIDAIFRRHKRIWMRILVRGPDRGTWRLDPNG